MSVFSDDLRKRAADLRDGANTILRPENAEALANDVTQQIAAIVGKVSAVQLDAIADLADYLRSAPAVDEKIAKRQAILERNNALRSAAARDDWTEFDRLAGLLATDRSGEATGG